MTALLRLRIAFVVFIAILGEAFSDADHTCGEKSAAALAPS
jgi:hypothetical protein